MSYGVIEGFYGETWGWSGRQAALPFLEEQGFSFFLYAPKADRRLRREWRQPHSAADAKDIRDFAADCRRHGLEFGVGLSPYGLHEDWDGAGRVALGKKLKSLEKLRLDWLGVLFDDMPGALPALAQTQGDIVKFVADAGVADTLMMCPTYYSEASILDRLFGQRPHDYLSDLGAALDDEVMVCWTGQSIVSERYPSSHLDAVANQLGRRPFIWDNYPVNDGPRMSRFLHLKAPDRDRGMLRRVAGLAVNPMNQSHLSRVPLQALAQRLQGRGSGSADARTDAAIDALHPEGLAAQLRADRRTFQEDGLDGMSRGEKAELIAAYSAHQHPAATEVVRWLKGDYIVSAAILTDA